MLMAAGFQLISDSAPSPSASAPSSEAPGSYLLLTSDAFRRDLLQIGSTALHAEWQRLSPPATQPPAAASASTSASHSAPPASASASSSSASASAPSSALYKKKKITSTHPAVVNAAARHKPFTKISREQMADKLTQRLHSQQQSAGAHSGSSAGAGAGAHGSLADESSGSGSGSGGGKIIKGKLTDFVADAKLRAEIARVRSDKHRSWRTTALARKVSLTPASLLAYARVPPLRL